MANFEEILNKTFFAILDGDFETVKELIEAHPQLRLWKNPQGFSFLRIAEETIREQGFSEERDLIICTLAGDVIPSSDTE